MRDPVLIVGEHTLFVLDGKPLAAASNKGWYVCKLLGSGGNLFKVGRSSRPPKLISLCSIRPEEGLRIACSLL
jgi:hypothetical protein